MTSKLRIRIGEVEIEYEGSDEFLKEELPELLKTAMELRKTAVTTGNGEQKGATAGGGGGSGTRLGTTKAVAAALKVNSGQDLLLAAAYKLTVGDKKETFTRTELLTEMKQGGSYYKTTYRSNLSNYIESAMNAGDLNETASNTYGLKAPAVERLEKLLANA